MNPAKTVYANVSYLTIYLIRLPCKAGKHASPTEREP